MHPEAKAIVAARPCGAMADLKAPTVTLRLQREVEPGITSFGVFLEFSEPVTGLNLSADSEDVLVDIGDHSEITGTGSQTFFTRITSSQDGELTITVPAGAVTDLAIPGNDNLEGSLMLTVDIPPTITSDAEAPVELGEEFLVTFTFSEPATGFTIRGLTVLRGTAVSFEGEGAVYTVLIEPTGVVRGCLLADEQRGPHDRVIIKVPTGAAHDSTGNPNQPGRFDIEAENAVNDRNRPTITVREVESCWGKEVNRSEDTPPVTGDFRLWMQTSWVSTDQLEEDDFSVENGELLLLRYGGEGVIWCANFEPAADGEVKIVIRKGAFGSEALPSVKRTIRIPADLPRPLPSAATPRPRYKSSSKHIFGSTTR